MDTVEEFTRDKERLWKLSSPELKRMVERRPGEAVEHYECYEERGPDEEFERRWGNSFPVYTTDPSINLQTIDLANMRIGGLGFKKADISETNEQIQLERQAELENEESERRRREKRTSDRQTGANTRNTSAAAAVASSKITYPSSISTSSSNMPSNTATTQAQAKP